MDQGILSMKGALQVITALNLTAHLWPKQSYVQDGDCYDFIIAGGGTAGCVLANRLTEDKNNKVLLIEAGGDPPIETLFPGMLMYLMNTRYDWNFTMQTNDFRCHSKPTIHPGSGKLLGGTSSINYMNFARGSSRDYQVWADAAKDDSWLWKNILPYFIKAEGLEPDILNSTGRQIHGTEGPLKLTKQESETVDKYIDALKEIGRDEWNLNTNQLNGYYHLLLTIANCKRQSTAYSYLRLAKDRPNLHVLKNTMVTKILLDKKKKAVGVVIDTEFNNIIKVYTKKEIILSAGAINSPQLLMLSGIGPKKHLSSKKIKVVSDLPVGENLQDNVAVVLVHKTEKIESAKRIDQCELQAGGLGGIVVLNDTNHSSYKSISLITERIASLLKLSSFTYELSTDIVEKIIKLSKGREVMLTLVTDLMSRARGKVQLNSTNPCDKPLISYDFFTCDDEIEKLRIYVEDFMKIEKTTFFQKIGAELINPICSICKDYEHRSKEYWRCFVQCFKIPTLHLTGTCAMGSVVDNRLRVFGVQGLRVVDASIMPTAPSGTSYAPTVIVAEKAADMIKGDNKTD